MSLPSPGTMLRHAVARGTIQVPGAPFALVARLAEEEGFEAVYLSGAALSAGVLAVPDIGLFTLDELAQQAGYLSRASSLPVLVDADTGFGGVAEVRQAVVTLEAAGVAAIQIEDQQMPKRCGHLGGKTLVSADAMSEKIATAIAARSDPELVIIARTDARGTDSLDEAIERGRRYLAAGADWIFPEALESREEFARFAEAVDAPLIANMTEFGKSPSLTLNELDHFGYAVALYPVTLLRLAMKAIEVALMTLAEEGTQKSLLDLMQTREELYDLLEYEGEDEASDPEA